MVRFKCRKFLLMFPSLTVSTILVYCPFSCYSTTLDGNKFECITTTLCFELELLLHSQHHFTALLELRVFRDTTSLPPRVEWGLSMLLSSWAPTCDIKLYIVVITILPRYSLVHLNCVERLTPHHIVAFLSWSPHSCICWFSAVRLSLFLVFLSQNRFKAVSKVKKCL